MEVEINVTSENIAEARKHPYGLPSYCPISFAVTDAGMICAEVYPDLARAFDDKANIDYEADLPLKAQEFVKMYDSGEPVGPLSFVLTFEDVRKKYPGLYKEEN